MSELANHLWQSTLFAALAMAAAFALRKNHARTRYWLWLAASMKFLLPFSLLVAIGARIETRPVASGIPAVAVHQISTTFAPAPSMQSAATDAAVTSAPWWPRIAAGLWIAGVIFLLATWFRRWWIIRTALRGAAPLAFDAPLPVLSSNSQIEPGVFGVLRPVLLMPEGIANRLSTAELDAILAHEIEHVRRRDNLTSALHMLVEVLFWFHPLVWWIGAKLVAERERACDEAVIDQGSHEPEVYAQGIVNVCKYYVESPLTCASGVSGADLRTRIEEIMTSDVKSRLTLTRKLLLSLAGIAAVAAPFCFGILRGQILPPPPQHKFEVASIKPGDPNAQNVRIGPGPQGGLRTENTTTLTLITFSYDLRDFQILGGPGWIKTERYNVTGTPDQPEDAPNPAMGRAKFEGHFNRQRERMRALLMDRFGLVMRAETREMPIYALTIAKGGHKLTVVTDDKKGPNFSTRRGSMTGTAIDISMLTRSLSSLAGRPVVDETGLTGAFDLKMEWTPDEGAGPDAAAGPSIFTALQEQLGLKLESKKGPAQVLVIEKIEKPTAN